MHATRMRGAKPFLSVTISNMVSADVGHLLEIEAASFDGEYSSPWTAEDFWHCYVCPFTATLVARVKRRPVGYLIANINVDRLVLLNLAVHPERRRQGVATQLIDALPTAANRRPCSYLEATCSEWNDAAHGFFRRMGFLGVRVDAGLWKGQDAYVFEKLT